MAKRFTWKEPVVKQREKVTHSFDKQAPKPKKTLDKELPKTRSGNTDIDKMHDIIHKRSNR